MISLAQHEEGAAATLPTPPTPTPPGNSRTCGVCSVNAAKYKCSLPHCGLPYCSIACNFEHKSNHPAVPEDEAPPPEPEMEYTPSSNTYPTPQPGAITTTTTTTQSHILAPLLISPELRRLFASYPKLKGLLGTIYDASQPPDAPRFLRPSPIGTTAKPFWTREQGVRDGTDALKEAKSKAGDDGEAVREFAELVVRLISPENVVNGNLADQGPGAQGDSATVVAQMLRGELGLGAA